MSRWSPIPSEEHERALAAARDHAVDEFVYELFDDMEGFEPILFEVDFATEEVVFGTFAFLLLCFASSSLSFFASLLLRLGVFALCRSHVSPLFPSL